VRTPRRNIIDVPEVPRPTVLDQRHRGGAVTEIVAVMIDKEINP